jgi:hypothetical protein
MMSRSLSGTVYASPITIKMSKKKMILKEKRQLMLGPTVLDRRTKEQFKFLERIEMLQLITFSL